MQQRKQSHRSLAERQRNREERQVLSTSRCSAQAKASDCGRIAAEARGKAVSLAANLGDVSPVPVERRELEAGRQGNGHRVVQG